MQYVDLARKGILLCLVGPAGSGKTSLRRRLLERHPDSLRASISVTTRAKREGEVDGQSYYFVASDEFERRVSRGEFFEWEEVHGFKYGTPRAAFDQAVAGACDVVLDIDVRGALSVRRSYPELTVVVFILPPSTAVMQQRIRSRGSIDQGEFARRLKTAQFEYDQLLQHVQPGGGVDYVLVNDDFERSVSLLNSLLITERLRSSRIRRESLEPLCSLKGQI